MPHERYSDEPDGIFYLRILGLEDLADADFRAGNDETIKGKEFWDHCGEQAQNTLRGFAALNPNPENPMYVKTREYLQMHVRQHATVIEQ